jgi:hypothetical protein
VANQRRQDLVRRGGGGVADLRSGWWWPGCGAVEPGGHDEVGIRVGEMGGEEWGSRRWGLGCGVVVHFISSRGLGFGVRVGWALCRQAEWPRLLGHLGCVVLGFAQRAGHAD